jgi:predicted DNA-binding protein
MRKSEKVLTIRLPDLELDKLEKYCCENKRTKTDVIREFIRSLDVAHK